MTKKILKDINDKLMFEILEKLILEEEYFNLKDFLAYLNIHKGTFKRWMDIKKVPIMYFNLINSYFNNVFKIDNENLKFQINDMFYTDFEEAKKLINYSLNFIKKNFEDIDINEYLLIEPSAGSGSFYFNFPKKFNSIGLDIEPNSEHIIKKDYFDFHPNTKKNIVIGNPPFGLRGNLALKFINHSAEFADFICFILPPLFNSNGKGSPMLRINKNFYLADEIKINNFYKNPNGEKVEVVSIFQIWTKKFSKLVEPILPPEKKSEWVKVYSISDGKTSSSKRNVDKIGKCNYYIASTTFKKIYMVDEFDDLPHKRGYGIDILKNEKQVKKVILSIDWSKKSFKSTNNANNMRTQIILDEINKGMITMFPKEEI